MEKIPFNKFNEFYLDHTKEISEKLMFILESGKYLRDKETLQLEKEIAKLCKRNFAVSTSSCTDALYFALITADKTTRHPTCFLIYQLQLYSKM